MPPARRLAGAALLFFALTPATACTGPEASPEPGSGPGDPAPATPPAGNEGVEAEGAASANASLPPTRECAAPDPTWVWCDDFEQDRLDHYFEYTNPERASFVRARGIGVRGSHGMRALFRPRQVDAGTLKLAIGPTPQRYFESVDGRSEPYRDVYWRFYLRYQEKWVGGGGDKLTRATTFSSPDAWAQAMIAHVWSGSGSTADVLVLDPASGTDPAGAGLVRTRQYNDFDRLRWLGKRAGTTPLFSPEHVGRWYCVESRVRLNEPGRSDGLFELWIDDRPEARIDGLDWVGYYDAYGINAIFLENYWNEGAPRAQERHFDAFVVSTDRIGCGR